MLEVQEIPENLYLYPSRVMHLMPGMKDIPREFKEDGGETRWNDFVYALLNMPVSDVQHTPKPGIDTDKAVRRLTTILRSWEPAYEHKQAAMAFLMSQWFQSITYKVRGIDGSMVQRTAKDDPPELAEAEAEICDSE